MLTGLRNAMRETLEGDFPSEAILESTVSVRDVFLDDPNAAVDGAENDPEIKGLIEDIPEYNMGEDKEIEKEVKALTESLVETELIR